MDMHMMMMIIVIIKLLPHPRYIGGQDIVFDGFVCLFVCLFVCFFLCFFVSKIMRKRLD